MYLLIVLTIVIIARILSIVSNSHGGHCQFVLMSLVLFVLVLKKIFIFHSFVLMISTRTHIFAVAVAVAAVDRVIQPKLMGNCFKGWHHTIFSLFKKFFLNQNC